jgi:hypothetical protein
MVSSLDGMGTPQRSQMGGEIGSTRDQQVAQMQPSSGASRIV